MTTIEHDVKDRYAAASQATEAELCCPVSYNPELLKALPQEIIERDYGCGDPSVYVREGDTVLDLGSGGGKICYIAAQVVGADGRVIGVDFNEPMLELARKYQGEMAEKLGYANVEFRKGRIQDLKLDLEKLEAWLAKNPVRDLDGMRALEAKKREIAEQTPLVADDSVDVIVSNCVLNLVASEDKKQLFAEMFRVLKRGGRAVISDIVSDEDVPEHLQRDPELWSGCISGAYKENEFLRAFEQAGFYGVEILKRDEQPWRTVEGIEFRSVTVRAWKGKQGPCMERKQAVIYKGPWRSVTDDDGHTLRRGELMAVCDKTFNIYVREPYAGQLEMVSPRENIPLDDATPFDCSRDTKRHPRELKGMDYDITTEPADDCCSDGGCC